MKTNPRSPAARSCLRLALLLTLSLLSSLPGAGAAVPAPPSTPEHARTRANELRAEIAAADELYFKHAAPRISDAEYDALKRELAAIEQAYPEFASAAAPVSVGDDRSGAFPTAAHRERMLSLRKAYTEGELRACLAQLAKRLDRPGDDLLYVVEPKFDGLAISVTYERGRMTRAVTRGNGAEGDDVTANARTIANLPAQLRTSAGEGSAANAIPELVELRGEIFIGFAEFRRINAEQEAAGAETFAHPRNLAAGTLKQTDPAEVAERRLEIVFYGVGACEPAFLRPASQQALHALIRAWGLPGVSDVRVVRGAEEAWKAVEAVRRTRASYPFPIDGAVVKLDDAAWQQELGVAADRPNWAIACKFPPDRVLTPLRAITWQVGRTGVLTPVAELAPVQLGGSVVARATLHNRAELERLGLRIGDFVYVEKAGEIVPAITGVERSRRVEAAVPYVFPDRCPSCRTVVVQEAGGAAMRCPNPDCVAQVCRRIEHFAGKAGVQIEGLGPAAIASLVEQGAVRSVADLYRLQGDDLKRARVRSPERVLAAVERSKRAALWRFVHGLGIPGVGAENARMLARQFSGLGELARAERRNFAAGSERTGKGVSTVTAESVLVFFAEPRNCDLVAALLAVGVEPAR